MKTPSEISRSLNANIQTRQITNAMYLLSVSEIRRMSANIGHIENYMHYLRRTIRDIITRSNDIQHSFLRQKVPDETIETAFLVISSDKSLCGAYNVNIVNLAIEQIRSAVKPVVFTTGRQGEIMLRNKGFAVSRTFPASASDGSIDWASDISDALIEGYLNDDFDEVYICFTQYKNQAHQYPTCMRLFPLDADDFADEIMPGENVTENVNDITIFEPSVRAVFESLANEYITGIIYSAIAQSAMSEHVARMNSMQAATRNADKMIESLRLQYNTARQLAITNEIAEISAASEVFGRGI